MQRVNSSLHEVLKKITGEEIVDNDGYVKEFIKFIKLLFYLIDYYIKLLSSSYYQIIIFKLFLNC